MISDKPPLSQTIGLPDAADDVTNVHVPAEKPRDEAETRTQAPATVAPLFRSRPNLTVTVPPGYVLAGELGRGGMGVVYLAEQTSLKRRVALKMIRGGGGASFEELARFRVEAEAVARLQHPNIVQIFEIGEYDGNPFFALEYVDGGSMASALSKKPWTPEESAAVVETLARAVHHAHQKNLVHRDLKPANVLLTADMTPKITDFGLAKRLEEGDSGHTRTGAVMGTPSYMAPEQASGLIHQIGPATDVYALGAILYECLTGQIVFRGTSVLDTLEMVRSTEPKPPSKVRPGIPADLETICLKAMAKESSARYSSALAMAQDLERFRTGEPILGRRAGVIQRVGRKAARNRTALAAGLAVIVALGTIPVGLLATRNTRTMLLLEEDIARRATDKSWDEAEADISRLALLDRERADDARQKLHDQFAETFANDLKASRLTRPDIPALEAKVAWLTARDSQRGGELQHALQTRLRAWQPVADVAAPFANIGEAFSEGSVRLDVDRLYSNAPMLLTNLSDQGTMRAEIEFQGDWTRASELGLVMAHRPDGPRNRTNGYAFVLRAAWPESEPETPPLTGLPASFEASGRAATLEILRDGVRLAIAPFQVRSGPVRLTTERDGGRLSIQLNGLQVKTIEDPVPLPLTVGAKLAVLWPRSAAVRHLSVEDQTLPPAERPLRPADDLLSIGRTADALALYEATGQDSSAETKFKSGLCLTQLNRGPEALALLDEVAAGNQPRWNVLAAFEAWRVRLKAGQFAEAEWVPAAIKARFPKDVVNQFVPAVTREEIAVRFEAPAVNWMAFDPKQIPFLDAAVRRSGALCLNNRTAEREILNLVLAHGLNGDYRRAREVADEHLEPLLDLGHLRVGVESPHRIARLHALMSRLSGQAGKLDDMMSRHLQVPLRDREDPEVRKQAFVPLRLEKARDLAHAGDLPAAEKELDAFLAEDLGAFSNYSLRSESRLMKGFARLKADDPAGAKTAWIAGTYARFLDDTPQADSLPTRRKPLIEAWMLASLSGTLTDDDAARMLRTLTEHLGPDDPAAPISAAFAITPAIMRGAWTSPRGREQARRMAFLDLTPAEYFWTPPRMLVYEKLRQELRPAATKEEDDALWQATVQLGEALRTGAVTKPQLTQLSLAWKGTTDQTGWGAVSPQLKPELRGPLAFVLGLRHRQLNKPAEATEMFKTAVADAAADSPLKKLAEAEAATGK